MWTLLEGRTGVALPRARVGAGRAKSMGGRASLLPSFLPLWPALFCAQQFCMARYICDSMIITNLIITLLYCI